MKVTAHVEAEKILREIGHQPDERIDVAEAALALAVLDCEAAELPCDLSPYRAHLAAIAADVAEEAGRGALSIEEQAEALRRVLIAQHGYRGDSETFHDLANANLMRVIDRKKGLPVSLGILFLHAARAQGWAMVGLNFPSHFLVRLEHEGERSILDPFNEGVSRSVSDLRELLKCKSGADTKLSPEHYAAVGNRDVLLRLQNNIKERHFHAERADLAAAVVERMLLFAPRHVMLWRELGLLNYTAGKLTAAIRSLETFQERATEAGIGEDLRRETAVQIQQLRLRLN
jgi:regulator of sirC expression with transglutaminase-like and TPR domain